MRRHHAFLLTVLALAAFFRFFLLHEIPPGLYPDEAANGVDALGALERADFRVFYTTNNGREGLFINLQALSIQIFGATPWALRSVSALSGTLTVLFFFLLAKEIALRFFPQRGTTQNSTRNHAEKPASGAAREMPRVGIGDNNQMEVMGGISRGVPRAEIFALLAAFLLAVSFWHVNFSRIGFRAILLPLLSTATFYFLLLALRTKKNSAFLFAGFASALALNTYIASRILPILLIPFFVLDGKKRHWKKKWFAQWTLFLCAFAFTILPLAGYFITHPQDFTGRAGDVSIFATEDPLREVFESAAKTLGMFTFVGDFNWRHNVSGAPLLDIVTNIFFLVGLVAALKRIVRRTVGVPVYLFILFWWGAMLLPSVATAEGLPHALRSLGAIPPTMLFSAVGAFALWNAFGRRLLPLTRAPLVSFVLVGILLLNFYQYFYRWAENPNVPGAFRSDLADIAQYLNDHQDMTRYVVINENGVALDTRGKPIPMPVATIRFLTNDTPDIRYLTPDRIAEIAPEFDKTLILFTVPPSPETQTSLKAIFPSIKPLDGEGINGYSL